MTRWPRKKPCVLVLVSLHYQVQTGQLWRLPWKLKNTETWRGCHINKTDDITSWKNKHSVSKRYWRGKKLPPVHLGTISAKLACFQNITGNIQKQISTHSVCSAGRREQPGTWLEALKKLWKMNLRCDKKRVRKMCLFVYVIFLKATLYPTIFW